MSYPLQKLKYLVNIKMARKFITKNSDSVKHWPTLRESLATLKAMDSRSALLLGEAPLRKSCRAVLWQWLIWLSYALKTSLLCLHPFLRPSTSSHPHALLLLRGLMGGLHLSALSWLLLGGKEAHPDGFQQLSWVFYGLLLIYSQFSILVNGHKLDWSHKS